MRILFWGTPAFALPSLLALEGEGHAIVGVVTQPDRPAGRGREMKTSPVKVRAESEGYPVLTPERPGGDEFLAEIAALEPELSVVVAYGHILKPDVLEAPERGSINVHASLLPLLRGAAPVTWAIARGHETTGVTVMEMTAGMDEGPILFQLEEPIGPRENATELGHRLSELGAEALVECLALMEADAVEPEEQDHDRATYAPKVDRDTARVDWTRDARQVADWIRAMDRIPGAWTTLEGDPIKLYRPVALEDWEEDEIEGEPGRIVLADPDDGLVVATGEGPVGAVAIEEVQPPGKRRMKAEDWLRGRGAEEGQQFE